MRGRARLGCLLLLFAIGCVGGDGGVARSGPVGVSGGGALASEIVGTWRHALFFIDDDGIRRSSETTWRFSSDGSAVRTIVARNFTDGVADVSYASARWEAQGTSLLLTFLSPSAGSVRLGYRVEGNTLYLGAQPFLRS